MLCFWSTKGGVGCSVTATAVARSCARHGSTLLVDLAGDLPLLLGVESPTTGVADWLAAAQPPPDALSRLELPITDQLDLLAVGGESITFADEGKIGSDERWAVLARLLAGDHRHVVVDLGLGGGRCEPLLDVADRSILVTRACYLALRAAVTGRRPDAVVLVREPGRALRRADVATAAGADVVATIDYDPAVARAVDAGLLSSRLPRSLRPLRALVPAPSTPAPSTPRSAARSAARSAVDR